MNSNLQDELASEYISQHQVAQIQKICLNKYIERADLIYGVAQVVKCYHMRSLNSKEIRNRHTNYTMFQTEEITFKDAIGSRSRGETCGDGFVTVVNVTDRK